MDGSLLDFPDAFLVALISAPRADATSLAAFSNICCMNTTKIKQTVKKNDFPMQLNFDSSNKMQTPKMSEV